MIKITVNGENKTIDSVKTISNLLNDLNIDSRKIAVELNLEIIPKSAYNDITVAENDKLEIVAFIGGG